MEPTSNAPSDPSAPETLLAADGLLAALPWGVLVLDERGVIRRVNPQAARWCGAAPEALLGQPLATADLPAALGAALRQLLEPGAAQAREVHLPEQAQWLALSATRQPGGWVLSGQDITPQRQHEAEALRLQDELARRTTDQYHALFHSMDQGFCVLELQFDDTGQQVVDFRYQQVNPVFSQQSGIPEGAQGKTSRELMPDLDPFWFDTYGRVVLTGESVRLEHYVSQVGRWFDVHVFRVGAPEARQVGVLFHDITARKQNEEQLRLAAEADTFRLRLADALAPLTDPVAMQEAVTRLARPHFGADRCYYVEIEGDEGIIRRDASADGVPSVAGTYPMADFALLQAVIAAGRPFSVRDVREDASVDEGLRQICGQMQIVSYLNVPVVKNGQPAGVLCLVQSTPREWTAAEMALAAEVAERTWAAVERARAEKALTASEEKYRSLFDSIDEGFCTVEVLFDAQGRAADYRFLETNPAFVRQTGLANAAGRTMRELVPAHEAFWFDTYGRIAQTGDAQRFEHKAAALGSFYDVYAFRIGAPADHRVAILFNDIAARKQTEEALSQSEVRYRELFELMQQGYGIAEILVDEAGRPADYRMLALNPQFEQLTGQKRETFLDGRTVREIAPELEEHWYEFYGNVALTGVSAHRDIHAEAWNRWFEVTAYPTGRPERRQVGIFFSDITERKRVEQQLAGFSARLEQQVAERTHELRESRRLLQTVFDASPTAIVVMRILHDAAGRAEDFEFLITNEFNKQLVGRDDLVGQRFSAMFPQTGPTGVLARLLQVATTGEPADFEQWYVGEGIQEWVRLIAVRQDGLLVLTSEVITARKQAEQERTRNLRLLEQAETVADLGSWDYDLLSQELLWSEGMYRRFGLPPGQPVRPDVYLQFVVEEDRLRAEQFVRCITTGSADFEETLRLRVGGQAKTVRLKVVVLYDEAGQPVRTLGVDLDISQLQRLEADNLRLRLSQQQALFEAVQAAQETERRRMAESLHNGIGQMLYATKLRLDRLHAPLLGTDSGLVAARNEADELLSEAIRQTRALSHELVPTVLAEFGLATALQDVGSKMSTPQLRLRCQVQLDEDAAPLAPALQMALYRMAQELAQNIVKHARGATAASLELETMPGWALLRAEDNGAGFAPAPAESPGLGLRSIRDRVALLGGRLETGAVITGGAYVRIRIPLPVSPAP